MVAELARKRQVDNRWIHRGIKQANKRPAAADREPSDNLILDKLEGNIHRRHRMYRRKESVEVATPSAVVSRNWAPSRKRFASAQAAWRVS
jgi:hypothetical protein